MPAVWPLKVRQGLKSLPQGNQVGCKPTLHSSPNQQHFRVAASRRHIWEKRQSIPIHSQIYWLILDLFVKLQ
jgi:hypothetical protein